ncbi:Gustatory receptor for sugar taste 43a [Eumeta japonica]|uniref:Gustatory receptor n=1 Tax=Eumeta variegata TaxID=151549 RepID=A0A4C1WTY4_EUMVA|nr:Gustatory receptor for sugar taste 43a [Eumeta japonica]
MESLNLSISTLCLWWSVTSFRSVRTSNNNPHAACLNAHSSFLWENDDGPRASSNNKCERTMTPLKLTKSERENNEKTSSFCTDIKIEKPEKCLVQGAHALLLRISKYAGLAPLKFEPHANGWVVSVSTSVWFCSYTLITVLHVQLDMKYSVRMNSSLGRGVALVDMLMIVLTACLGVYAAPMSMRKMIHYKSVLTEIDRRLDLHSGPPLERKIVMLGWMFLGYAIPFVFLDYWYQVYQSLELRKCYTVAYQYIGFYIQCIIVIILELQFTFTTLTVLARFTALNDALAQTAMEAGVSGNHVALASDISHLDFWSRIWVAEFTGLILMVRVDEPSVRAHSKLFEVSNKIPVLEQRKNLNMKVDTPTNLLDPAVIVRHHSPVFSEQIDCDRWTDRYTNDPTRVLFFPFEAVRRLAALHGALCDVVTELGASYSLPLVVILLSTLLHLIVSPYYLVVDLVSLQPRPAFAAMQSLWSINHMFRLLMIVEPCYLTKLQYVQHILNIREVTGTVQRVLQFEPKQLLCETAMFRKVLRQLGRQIDLSVDFVRLFHQRKEVFGDFTHASTGVSCLPLLARWSNHLLCVRQRKPVVVRCHLFGEAAHLASSSYCEVALSTDHQRSGQTAGDPSGDLQPAALSALHVLFANGNMRFGPSARSFG